MFHCAQCPDVIFSSQEELDSHFKSSGVWHPYCWDCDIYFDNDAELDEHTFHRHRLHNCSHCSLGFLSESAVDKHVLAKHGRYKCEPCDAGFETEVGREKHYRVSRSHPTCSECGHGFKDKGALCQHTSQDHPRHPCHVCKRTIDLDDNQRHQLATESNISCAGCLLGSQETFEEGSWQAVGNIGETQPLLEEDDEDYFDDAGEYGSDTESDLEWTPALSEYESATEDDDSFQEDLDGTPTRLHTNSPAWASLFPLPDSPDIACHALPCSNEFYNIMEPPQQSLYPCIDRAVDESMFQLPDPFASSSDMKTRTISSASTMSHVAAGSDSPLSQASLLGSEWSCPVALDRLFCLWVPPPTISTLVPGVANDALPSAFPHMQDIPHQFSESIFTEEFCEDRPDGGAAYPAWDGATEDTCQPILKSPEAPSRTVTALVESPRQQSATQNPGLHCRVCLKANCDDVTATMCGHIFCNKCITQAIIANSKCPVCATPALLYCLFRIDLSS